MFALLSFAAEFGLYKVVMAQTAALRLDGDHYLRLDAGAEDEGRGEPGEIPEDARQYLDREHIADAKVNPRGAVASSAPT